MFYITCPLVVNIDLEVLVILDPLRSLASVRSSLELPLPLSRMDTQSHEGSNNLSNKF